MLRTASPLWGPVWHTVTVTPREFHPQESPVSDDPKKKKKSYVSGLPAACALKL